MNNIKILQQAKKYRETHKKEIQLYHQIHKKEFNKYNKEYRKLNNEKIKKQREIYRKNHIKEIKKYRKIYKTRRNKLRQNRFKTDINYRLSYILRRRMWDALKQNRKSNSTMKLVGCSIDQLKNHLKKQFKIGMTWQNYGKWHIDHIKPCASFNLSKSKEQIKCFHYSNLQPLWAEENYKKHDKIKRGE